MAASAVCLTPPGFAAALAVSARALPLLRLRHQLSRAARGLRGKLLGGAPGVLSSAIESHATGAGLLDGNIR